jgi:hypothetical protein
MGEDMVYRFGKRENPSPVFLFLRKKLAWCR